MGSPSGDRTKTARVALVGPVNPYRGGIAQYATRLRRALADLSQVRTYSFSRQYPAWLYPGQSDIEPGKEGERESGVAYCIDALNPLTWVATARRIAGEGCDLAIINWWTLFWAPGFALIARILRRRGVRVLLLCHNLFDHDSRGPKRFLSLKLLAQADGYLVHTREQAETLKGLFPLKAVLQHPHPVYNQLPPPDARLPKRGRLELLFFGFIRPYKGLDVLVAALAQLADTEIYLTVAGEPWCDADELRRQVEASGAPNVELHLGYVDEVSVANYFSRADLAVLPYRTATGSGVAAVAYHYDCPLLATRVGGLEEVVENGTTGFLVEPNDPTALAERIRGISRADLEPMRERVRHFKTGLTWESLARCILDLTASPAESR